MILYGIFILIRAYICSYHQNSTRFLKYNMSFIFYSIQPENAIYQKCIWLCVPHISTYQHSFMESFRVRDIDSVAKSYQMCQISAYDDWETKLARVRGAAFEYVCNIVFTQSRQMDCSAHRTEHLLIYMLKELHVNKELCYLYRVNNQLSQYPSERMTYVRGSL